MTFLKSSKSSEPFPREILDLEQKIKMILHLCTIGYGITYGIKKKLLWFLPISTIWGQKEFFLWNFKRVFLIPKRKFSMLLEFLANNFFFFFDTP